MGMKIPYTAVDVVSTSESDNKMKARVRGDYELPYPMTNILEVERWVAFFEPQPLYGEVSSAISGIDVLVKEGSERMCEGCKEMGEVGFDYEGYFTEDEYLRIISRSWACSLECAIEYAFMGEYAPSVEEFKDNPEAYKSIGLVDYDAKEVMEKFRAGQEI